MKKLNSRLIFCIILAVCAAFESVAGTYSIFSPDKSTEITVNVSDVITWSVSHDNDIVLAPSAISLTLDGGKVLGANPKVSKVTRRSADSSFATPFYRKSSVAEKYNALSLKFKGGYSLQFRAFDGGGAAYRFELDGKDSVTVADEQVEFNFTADHKAFIPYINDNRGGDRWSYSFESYYDETPISQMHTDSLAITPLLIELPRGRKVAVMEGGLEDYPGMFLIANPDAAHGLKGSFAPIITSGHWGGYMNMNWISDSRAPYIARIAGKRTLPWRAIVVSDSDKDLLDNDMAQLLAPECRIADTSWIRPGKVAWDWWNTTNVSGVDFRAGMNTDTYKYFIDFAADNGIEYIIIDAGWSGSTADWKGESLMSVNPDIDLKQIIAHGNDKGVGVILWASWALTDKEKDIAFPHYAAMGVKGFKVDFLDRDDQQMMASMWDIVRAAADNHLLIDLHGMKPTGIQRAYPNIVNFEGVKGLENCKWAAMGADGSKDDFLRYDVTIPYIRMLAGPMDYTPGAMTNKARQYFRPVNDHPMSQGTRVHQMAMYTLYEAPLQMLADSPTAYMKNQECTDFIAKVPTVFDRTVPLAGEVGEYVALARSKGDIWWVGAMTNWTPRDITIDFSFLPAGRKFSAEIFTDGINADTEATDYKRQVITVDSSTRLPVHMAAGGGFTTRLSPTD